jgi:uncharacterized membrane protein HdeD (DUF308 family)
MVHRHLGNHRRDQARKEIPGEWLLALAGLASLAFGFLLLLLQPGAGALVLIWWIAAYALYSAFYCLSSLFAYGVGAKECLLRLR